MRYIHDDYMDGLYGTDDDPVEGRNTRLTVLDADGFWLMDTNDPKTAQQSAASVGGIVKPYDGRDKYR